MVTPKVSHGRSNRSIAVGGYRVTEASYEADQRIPRHEHAFSSWTYVLRGGFEERFAHATLVCPAGSVLSKPATADHSNHYGRSGAHCLIIEITTFDAELSSKPFAAPSIFTGGALPRLAAEIARELNSPDRVSPLVMEGLFIELWTATSRAINTQRRAISKKWLNSVRDQIEAEFRSPPSLSALAKLHDLHPAYLCHEFKAAFGIGIGEYARTLRFEWARTCLRQSKASISDIAHAAGFSDQAHFTRDFKARAGTTPRRYRVE